MFLTTKSLTDSQKLVLKEIEKLPYTADNVKKALELCRRYYIYSETIDILGSTSQLIRLVWSVSISVGFFLLSLLFHSVFLGALSLVVLVFGILITGIGSLVDSDIPVVAHSFFKKYKKEQKNNEKQKLQVELNQQQKEISKFLGIKPKEPKPKNILIDRIQNKYIPELVASFNLLDKDIQEEKAKELDRVMNLFSSRIDEIKNLSKEEQRIAFDRELSLAEKKANIAS